MFRKSRGIVVMYKLPCKGVSSLVSLGQGLRIRKGPGGPQGSGSNP